MADISATAADILKGGRTDIDGTDLGEILIRLVDAVTDPPSYYLASGDVTVNGVESVVAGTGIAVDNTDPNNPIISATGAPGGIDSIVAGSGITVDATDPSNPIVSADASTKGFTLHVSNRVSGLNRFIPIAAGFFTNNGDAPTVWDNQAGSAMGFAGTLKNLYITSDNGTASDDGNVFTIYKNGVATALVVTIATGQQSGSDTSHGVSFVAGDSFAIKYTGTADFGGWDSVVEVEMSAIPGNGNVESVLGGTGITVDNTDPNNPIVSVQGNGRTSLPFFFAQPSGPNRFYGFFCEDSATSGDADYTTYDAHTTMPFAGTLTKFYILASDTPSNPSSEIFFVSVNGVDSAITATITEAGPSADDLIHTVPFNAGDQISLHYDGGSSGHISGFSGIIGVIWD